MKTKASDHGTTITRLITETEAGRQLKELYHYRCQICGVRLTTPIGPYVEVVHIRPRTTPHDGPDSGENMLCLCPNHHILFALGSIAIADDFSLLGQPGQLTLDFRHRINKEHLRYHRQHCWLDPDGE